MSTERTTAKPQLYRVPRDLHARAAAEAKRQCKSTGTPVTWQNVIRRALETGLPEK
jgi:predicted HicB family RNase H-like nuclease